MRSPPVAAPMANPWHQPDAAPAHAGTAIPRVLEGVRNMPPPHNVPTFVLEMTATEEVPSKRARLERQLLSQASEANDIVAAALEIAERLTEEEARSPSPEPAAAKPRFDPSPNRNSDKTKAIAAAVAWRALTLAERLDIGMERHAKSLESTRNAMNRYVDFWGDWRRAVPGHVSEYRARQKPRSPKPLREASKDYQARHPGRLGEDMNGLLAFLKSSGVKSVGGLKNILRWAANKVEMRSAQPDVPAIVLGPGGATGEGPSTSAVPGIHDLAAEDLAALEAALLEGFAATGFEGAAIARNPNRPKNLGSDNSEVIRAAPLKQGQTSPSEPIAELAFAQLPAEQRQHLEAALLALGASEGFDLAAAFTD